MNHDDQPKSQYYEVHLVDMGPAGVSYRYERSGDDAFDDRRFYTGERIAGWPDAVHLRVSGLVQDGVYAGLHWIVFSDRVRQALQQCGLDEGIQFLPITVVDAATGIDQGVHWVINILRQLKALDATHTRWLPGYDPAALLATEDDVILRAGSIVKPALRDEIVHEEDVFRLEECPVHLIVSSALRDCLEDAEAARGFKFKPIQAY